MLPLQKLCYGVLYLFRDRPSPDRLLGENTCFHVGLQLPDQILKQGVALAELFSQPLVSEG